MDAGFALGSDAAKAVDYWVDTRILFFAGVGAECLGLLGSSRSSSVVANSAITGEDWIFHPLKFKRQLPIESLQALSRFR